MQQILRLLARYRTQLSIVAGLFLLFVACLLIAPCRVGDGAEYYAMFLSWAKSWRPFLTEVDWGNYRALEQGGSIHGMVPVEMLRGWFPYLLNGQTADMPHFWFYSFCAALNHWALAALGLSPNPHTCFLILHWELSCIPSLLALHLFGKSGLAVVALLVLSSPILWFVNKVHTEFFTFSLTLGAVICLLGARNLVAALLLALASTQNISFSALSVLALLFEIRARRRGHTTSFAEIVLLLATVLAIAIHPAYSLIRHGVYDPIVAYGGALPGLHPNRFYVWFFDPDIGLFPNYPLAVILVVLAATVLRKDADVPTHKRFLAFAAAFVAISLAAQSSTANLNSGATPGVARYALWYLCLLFLPGLAAIRWLDQQPWVKRALPLALVAPLCVANITTSWPGRPESYSRPTPLSHALQKSLPFLYDPPAEIFAERFGGLGEALPRDLLAVVGPDCRKILVFKGEACRAVLDANRCGYDLTRLAYLLRAEMGSRIDHAESYYVRLGDAESKTVALR